MMRPIFQVCRLFNGKLRVLFETVEFEAAYDYMMDRKELFPSWKFCVTARRPNDDRRW